MQRKEELTAKVAQPEASTNIILISSIFMFSAQLADQVVSYPVQLSFLFRRLNPSFYLYCGSLRTSVFVVLRTSLGVCAVECRDILARDSP